jgi:tetratricopeptide (TPR) repeat protein
VASHPDHAQAHTALADLYLQLNQGAKAVHSAERALQLQPAMATALNLRGMALSGMGLYEQALASFDAALQGNEDFATAQFHRGHALAALKRHQEAADAYAAALKAKPDYPYVSSPGWL